MEIVKTNKQTNKQKYWKWKAQYVKNTVDSIISRQDQEEERLSGMEDKIEEILYSYNKKKRNKELWSHPSRTPGQYQDTKLKNL
jgi:uncharacterized membrane-anchored protein